MFAATSRTARARWIVAGVIASAGLGILFAIPDRAGSDEKEGAAARETFGPLADGVAKSHEGLIKKGWVYLFDSRVPAARHKFDPLGLWRLRNPNSPDRNHWTVVEEKGERILRNTIRRGDHGSDLISLQSFWDFDIHAELRVSANSGLYLRGRYEIQINDTAPDKKDPGPADLGGIYSVSKPRVNAAKGSGVWQTIDASIRGYTITVYLNGQLIQDGVEIPARWRQGTGSQLGGGDGVSGSPESPGPIFLQGDHGSVEFRNIRVRPAR